MPASQTLRYPNPRHLSSLYCGHEENLTRLEKALDVRVVTHDDWLQIDGPEPAVARTVEFGGRLNEARTQGLAMRSADFLRLLTTFTASDVVRHPLVQKIIDADEQSKAAESGHA